eukprot:GDKJ01022330.1.p1 GENE.GDKJ01022330.1~~GDKJ01022330.1.p1  ORF type:complete len:650 (+),score=104.67 GDKJ01022330.1:104-1951(+)
MTLRTSCVKLQNAWSVTIPKLESDFKKRTKGTLVMDTWVDAASLSFDNSLQDVCSRGFKVPTKGLRVSLGNLGIPGISPPDNSQESYAISNARVAAGRRLFEFILCKAGIGRSIVLNSEEELLSDRFELPIGYDSVFLKSQKEKEELNRSTAPPSATLLNKGAPPGLAASLAIAAENENSLSPALIPARSFRHDYVVFDTSQVLPMFAVQFVFDPTSPESLLARLCDSCNQEAASLWCAADQAALCPECDEYIHSRNKLTRRHVRVSINERETPPPPCPEHKDELMTLYCPSCRLALCRQCRSHGTHSYGPAALHRIVLLKDAYASAVADTAEVPSVADFILGAGNGGSVAEATNKRDRSLSAVHSILEGPSGGGTDASDSIQKASQSALALSKRRQWIEEQLQVLDDIERTVRANTIEAEERTIAILEDALKELQDETEKDMSRLLSDQIEIRRQLDQLDWADSFLHELQGVIPAADFLYAWLRHCRLTEELSTLGVSTFPEVQLYDLRIEGGVHLLTEAALRQQTALQRQRALEVAHQTSSQWAAQERSLQTNELQSRSQNQTMDNTRHVLNDNASARPVTKAGPPPSSSFRPGTSGRQTMDATEGVLRGALL